MVIAFLGMPIVFCVAQYLSHEWVSVTQGMVCLAISLVLIVLTIPLDLVNVKLQKKVINVSI